MLRFSMSALLFATLVLPATVAATPNALFNDPSPYLALHGEDPVKWQHWNARAIEQAKKQDKLLFVSIGYFSCHWCHVMQKESYQNPEIAELLNKGFISVKVDRELDPALDARLIEFVERTRGYSGWPLNVFITPEGYPLLGLVYLPPADFKNLLNELHSVWQKEAASLKADARAAAKDLAPKRLDPDASLQTNITRIARKRFVDAAMLHADKFLGGFGEQGKFPSVPQLMALINTQAVAPDSKVEAFIRTTLDNMHDLGLHDQLAGGFFRYTVDPQWRVPHFEKMLYDNALLASVYFRAAEVLNDKRYEEVALQTVKFMRRELLTSQGALAASLSALDDKGIEGGYYLWQKEDLKKYLTDKQYELIEAAWTLKGGSTTEEGYLPLMAIPLADLAQTFKRPEKQLLVELNNIRESLLTVRNKRTVPRDNKILAAWNGLAISAFVTAARHDKEGPWLSTANTIRNYITSKLWDGENLLRARDENGKVYGTVSLTDYVAVAEGLLDLSDYSGDDKDKNVAKVMIERAWRGFVNDHGFRRTEESLLALPQGEVVQPDSPIYSPSAQLLRVSLRAFDKQHPLYKRAVVMLANGQDLMLEDPYWFATQVDALSYLQQ